MKYVVDWSLCRSAAKLCISIEEFMSAGEETPAMPVCAAAHGSEASSDSVIDAVLEPSKESAGSDDRDVRVAVEVRSGAFTDTTS